MPFRLLFHESSLLFCQLIFLIFVPFILSYMLNVELLSESTVADIVAPESYFSIHSFYLQLCVIKEFIFNLSIMTYIKFYL